MRFTYYTRELAGWALILIGLVVLWNAYGLFLKRWVFEAVPVMFMGFIVFRGGIHLLKVAVAAQASRALPEAAAGAPRRGPQLGARPIGPTPAKAVMPGPKARQPVGGGRA
jgi:hypothetical protein